MGFKKYSGFIFLFAMILISSCKKDDLESQTGNPVFYAKGSLDGNPFSLSAGIGNNYMYSSFDSDQLDVYRFNGEIRKKDCVSPCPQSMRVYFRDYRSHATSPTAIDSALFSGMYNFVTPTSLSNTVAFTSDIYADSVISYSWTFGDGGVSTQPNPVHTYTVTGSEQVCLTINGFYTNIIQANTICDSIDVGFTNPLQACFTDSILNPDTISFRGSAAGGSFNYNFFWRFSDNFYTYVQNFTRNFPTPGVYSATIYVNDGVNPTAHHKRNIPSPGVDSITANFTYQDMGYLAPDFSKVVVEWTDASGIVYTSANPSQPSSSTFQVLSVENYDANENQQPTKKIHMLVNCTLYNGSSTMLLQNADIVFAVAY
jgi:PKD repeat protein